jgi:glycosyltransferase involved in cell wall biosynthesis
VACNLRFEGQETLGDAVKQVFVLVPSLRMGGAETRALRHCELMLGAGYNVTLITIFRVNRDFYASYLGVLQQLGLHYHALLDTELSLEPRGGVHYMSVLVRSVGRLKVLFEKERPEVVYTCFWYASLIAWVTRTLTHYRPRLVFNEAIAAIDPMSAAEPTHFVAGPKRGRKRDRTDRPLALGFLGGFEGQKGLERLLDVASGLHGKGRAFKLKVAGSGSLEEYLGLEIDRRGLTAHVSLQEPIEDLADFFVGMDLLLLTGRHESLNNVVVEANAYGVAALVMRIPKDPAEIVREGVTGFLVANSDVREMVAFLAEVTTDRLVGMREACQALAQKAYSARSQQRRWRHLMEQVGPLPPEETLEVGLDLPYGTPPGFTRGVRAWP